MCAKIILNHQKESKKIDEKKRSISSLKYGFQFQETYELSLIHI